MRLNDPELAWLTVTWTAADDGVKLPLDPVTVRVADPAETHVMFNVALPDPPVILDIDSVPVATPGIDDCTARLTVPVNPPVPVTVIIDDFVVSPTLHVTLVGAADRVKACDPVPEIVNGIVTECVRYVAVPVTEIVNEPAVEHWTVNVDVPVPARLVGLSVAVIPGGNDDAPRLTVDVNPAFGVIVIVAVAVPPVLQDNDAALDVMSKSGVPPEATWNVTVIGVLVTLPAVPVTCAV